MQDFTRPSGRLRALPLGARAVYTVFLVFTLAGLALTLWLTHDMVGLDLSTAGEYYGGEAAPVEEAEVMGGPALVLPPDGEDLAAFDERAAEPDLPFEDVVKGLRASGKL